MAEAGTVLLLNKSTQSPQGQPDSRRSNRMTTGLVPAMAVRLPALQDFGDGGQVEVMIAGDFIAFADDLECLDIDALERIDVGSVLAIAEDAVAVRVRTRGHGGGVDFRRTEIDRVMVLEEHAIARELIERGGVRLRDEVRPHAVPDHHDDVLGLASRESCGGGGGEQDGQNNGKRSHDTTFYR